MSSSIPRLVVFDAGGVIVRLARLWDGVLARAGVTIAVDTSTPTFVEAYENATRDHQTGTATTAAYLGRVAALTGLSADQVEDVLMAQLVEEYPGLDAVFDALERAGIETALLSNTNAFHWELMVPELPAAGRFPAMRRIGRHFGSHLLGVMKPDPSIFAAVEQATGLSGSDVLFFDDVAANVGAARAFGWRAVLIDPDGDPAQQILAALSKVGVPAG